MVEISSCSIFKSTGNLIKTQTRVLGEKPGKPGGSDKENTASNGKPRSRANSIASRDRSNSRDAGRGHRSTSREGSRRRSTSKEGSSRASTASNGSGSDRGRQQSALNRISEDGGAADDGGGGGGADDAGGGGGGELETLAEEESTAPTPAAVNGEAENGGDGAPLQNGDLGEGDGGGGAEDPRAEADRDEQPPEPESDRPKTSRQGRMSARRSARPQPMKPDHTEGGGKFGDFDEASVHVETINFRCSVRRGIVGARTCPHGSPGSDAAAWQRHEQRAPSDGEAEVGQTSVSATRGAEAEREDGGVGRGGDAGQVRKWHDIHNAKNSYEPTLVTDVQTTVSIKRGDYYFCTVPSFD